MLFFRSGVHSSDGINPRKAINALGFGNRRKSLILESRIRWSEDTDTHDVSTFSTTQIMSQPQAGIL